MRTMKSRLTLWLNLGAPVAAAFALALFLVACKGSGSSGKGGGGYERTGQEPTASVRSQGETDREANTITHSQATDEASLSGTGNDKSSKNVVTVHLDEYSIGMPSTLKPGQVTFRVSNSGKKEHNFEIKGNGVDKKFDNNLAAGETRTMTVNLKPGKYTVTCPVFGHATMGMETDVTVGS